MSGAGATLPAILAVFAGGGVGSCCRYGVSRLVARHYGGRYPLATSVINLSGSIALGFLLGVPPLHGSLLLLLLGTGVLGGYTTFSTAALETMLLLRDGSWGAAVAMWVGGALLGLLGADLGLTLAAALWPGAV